MTVVTPVVLRLIDLHQDLPGGHASQSFLVRSMRVVHALQRDVVLEPGVRGSARVWQRAAGHYKDSR
jgi:hypothetical protein